MVQYSDNSFRCMQWRSSFSASQPKNDKRCRTICSPPSGVMSSDLSLHSSASHAIRRNHTTTPSMDESGCAGRLPMSNFELYSELGSHLSFPKPPSQVPQQRNEFEVKLCKELLVSNHVGESSRFWSRTTITRISIWICHSSSQER